MNKLGLHTRPATSLVNLASKFTSDIFLKKDNTKVNAKSIMGVLVLAAENGSTIIVEADGDDENQAVNEIKKLAAKKFNMD